jgi:hypothetical protein
MPPRAARVEDFPVRPDDDELLVAEFEMLELEPELDERLRVTVDAVLRAGEPEVELWRIDPELLELARLSTIPVRALQRWTPDRREHELARLRAEQAAIRRAERRGVRRRPGRSAPRRRASLATGHTPRGAQQAIAVPGVRGRERAGGHLAGPRCVT